MSATASCRESVDEYSLKSGCVPWMTRAVWQSTNSWRWVRNGRCRVRSHRAETGAYVLADIGGTLYRRRIDTVLDLLDKPSLRHYVRDR